MTTAYDRCRYCGAYGTAAHVCAARALPASLAPPVVAEAPPERAPWVPEALGADAKRDLEILARWLVALEGRATAIEPTIRSGRALNGRADHVDRAHAELAYAVRVLDRVASLPRPHALALLYVYLWCGAETRGEEDGGAVRSEWTTRFDVHLGEVFAAPHTRLGWLVNPVRSQAKDAARRAGRTAREQAVAAYQGAGAAATAPPTWLATARDEISRHVRANHDAQRAGTTVRRENSPRDETRKERRAYLQKNHGNGGNGGKQ
jgi:hypothetical protein